MACYCCHCYLLGSGRAMLLMSFLNIVLCTCSQIGSKCHPKMSNALTTFKQFNKCREIQYCFFFRFLSLPDVFCPCFWNLEKDSLNWLWPLKFYKFFYCIRKLLLHWDDYQMLFWTPTFEVKWATSLINLAQQVSHNYHMQWGICLRVQNCDGNCCLRAQMAEINALQSILFSLSSVMWTKFIHCGLGST